ncbi:GyrI-like domain-containing protein [Maribacter sp. 2-571]|uniref:GyrI-like domain-containing protein n=1 Tax=Maribacter sp. 2-571 TaxID=3417569 RepID=UPI003D332D25
MGKKIAWGIGLLLLAGLGWYLFLKPYDYLITFKTRAIPGTINQTLKKWNATISESTFLGQESLTDFTYEQNHNDSLVTYRWHIDRMKDSLSKVKVYVTEPQNSFYNKLVVPFTKNTFVRRSEETILEAMNILADHLEAFKVAIVGEAERPAAFCVCIALQGSQQSKAGGMMRNYSYLTGVVAQNKLVPKGHPFVEITDWQMEKDSISYNFCNPIIEKDSLPPLQELFYKKIPARKAVKALYNGNYITSDRAWYHLLEYAEKKGITLERKPFEIFNNNPNMGDPELTWEAEVYMPVK